MADIPREDLKKALAEKLFSTMMTDLIMDTALLAHKECRKRLAKELGHVNLVNDGIRDVSLIGNSASLPLSSGPTSADDNAPVQANGTAANSQKQDPVLLDCLNCKRPVTADPIHKSFIC